MFKVLTLNFVTIFVFTFLYFGLVKAGGDHFNGLDKSSSLVDTVYFAFTVQSTVGFGDIYPKTKAAKMLVMIQQSLLILGVVDLLSTSKPKPPTTAVGAVTNVLKKPSMFSK
jgi:hypothetical protein